MRFVIFSANPIFKKGLPVTKSGWFSRSLASLATRLLCRLSHMILTSSIGPKKAQKLQKIGKSTFSQKLVFSQFRLKLGRSGGVWGDGVEHTKTLSRTFAGSGLTRPQKSTFQDLTVNWKVTSSQNGLKLPLRSSQSQGLLVERPSAKIHFGK